MLYGDPGKEGLFALRLKLPKGYQIPPHTHPNEELVIIKEGTVEVFSGGTWKRLGPGSIVFNASNSPHALRNVGDTPTTYHVINWKTPLTPKN